MKSLLPYSYFYSFTIQIQDRCEKVDLNMKEENYAVESQLA